MNPLLAKQLVPIACVVALLAGCAPRQAATRTPYTGPTDSLDKVVREVNANNSKVTILRCAHTFEATLVDDKGKAATFSGGGYLLFTKPENLLLTASGVIPYFEIGANDERYWFTAFPDEVSTQWWGEKGKLTDQAPARSRSVPTSCSKCSASPRSTPTSYSRPCRSCDSTTTSDAYMLVWNRPQPTRWIAEKEVWYDVETKLPRLINLFDADGRIILRAYLTDHQAVPETGGKIATKYDLYFPETKSRMAFRLTEVKPYITKGRIRIPNPGSFAFPRNPA